MERQLTENASAMYLSWFILIFYFLTVSVQAFAYYFSGEMKN